MNFVKFLRTLVAAFINLHLNIDNEAIKSVLSIGLLGIILDDKLNFNLHIGNIIRLAANELNSPMRLKPF